MKSVGPSPKDVEARICWTVELAEKTYLTRLEADHVAQALPGQFLQLCVRADFSPLLRLPLSVCAADPATGTVDVAYEDVGPKTHILSRLPSGSQVGCMGPLGNYFPDPVRILDSARLPDTNKGAVLLVGGGRHCCSTAAEFSAGTRRQRSACSPELAPPPNIFPTP